MRKYADLVVKVGVNLQPDQLLVINSPLECADFARLIAESAFKAGAHDVVVSWGDEQLAHIRFAGGKKEIFKEFPEWKVRFYQDYAEQGAAFVSIAARNPEIINDSDSSVRIIILHLDNINSTSCHCLDGLDCYVIMLNMVAGQFCDYDSFI